MRCILLYGITSSFGKHDRFKVQIFSLVKTAGKIMGMPTTLTPQDIFEQSTIRQARRVPYVPSHVLTQVATNRDVSHEFVNCVLNSQFWHFWPFFGPRSNHIWMRGWRSARRVTLNETREPENPEDPCRWARPPTPAT